MFRVKRFQAFRGLFMPGVINSKLLLVTLHDLKIVMGDFNAQIIAHNIGWEEIYGKEAD